MAKGTYRLGRILAVHADTHGTVRTVTVGLRRQDRREAALPYVSKALEEITLGVQRIADILPIEEQTVGDEKVGQVDDGDDTVETKTEVHEILVDRTD